MGGLRDARDLATPRRCPPRSTPTRASPRCSSSRATPTTSARPATPTSGQVPGPDRRHAAEALTRRNPHASSRSSSCCSPRARSWPSSRTPTRRASRPGCSTSSPRSSRRWRTPASSAPSPCRRRTRSGSADGAPGAALLAAARRLHHQGDARHRRQAADRDGADPLHQQLARHPPVRLDAGRPEPVPAGQRGLARCSRPRAGSAAPGSPAASRSRASRRARVASRRPRRPPRPARGRGRAAALATPLAHRVDDTMMKVDLAEPLAPGETATFDVAWHFHIPEHGADRMGRDGALYELAQWYPRVAVYDDVRGWNTEPYLGQGEFYLEYGDYRLRGHRAGRLHRRRRRGALQNPREVLTPTQIARLAQARSPTRRSHIVTQDELTRGAARPKQDGHADVAVRGEERARRRLGGVARLHVGRVELEGHPGARPTTGRARSSRGRTRPTCRACRSRNTRERWFQYPWPQISAVEGPISGMEYPMLAMENQERRQVRPVQRRHARDRAHVVPDDRRLERAAHMWQDEGFNTFINTFSEARAIRRRDDDAERVATSAATSSSLDADADRRSRSERQPDRINPQPRRARLREAGGRAARCCATRSSGPEAFDDAFRKYIRRWAFKHPPPADFFRTMEDVGGPRLDWFWRGFFYTTAALDQSVEGVEAGARRRDPGDAPEPRARGDAGRARARLRRRTKTTVKLPVEIWYGGNRLRIPGARPGQDWW